MDIRIGVKKDGTITAGEAILRYQAGAFPGSPVTNGCMYSFAPYNIEHQLITVGATSFATVQVCRLPCTGFAHFCVRG